MPDRSRDPLDHLIRSTVPTTVASAPPRRSGGTRSRAGNAMARTRAGLLDGARRAVGARGTRRTTMNDIAAQAGVAKATLYNHFRTKDDVWSALVEAEVRALAMECEQLELVEALAHAARRLSDHPALRRVAETEPVALAGLLTRRPTAPGWRAAEEAVRARLAADGLAGDDLVLRWLASHLAAPATPPAIRAAAEALAAACPPTPPAPNAPADPVPAACPRRPAPNRPADPYRRSAATRPAPNPWLTAYPADCPATPTAANAPADPVPG